MSDCPKFLLLNRYQHVVTRFVAFFIIAPILMYYGYKYNNIFLKAIGIMTFCYDGITFYYTIKTPSENEKAMYDYLLFISIGAVCFIIGKNYKY